MKKVLVTGATGFIGTYVIEELLLQQVLVIATSSNKQKAQQCSWFNKVIYIEFDLASFDEQINYYQFFDAPDSLVHLAWQGLPNYKSDFHLNDNLPLHQHFLTNLIQHGLKDLTVTGTCFEYGMQEGQLSEEMECHPDNAYAIAKNELRKYIEHISAVYAVNLKWVRLFYMYGKGQNPKSLTSQLDKAIEENATVFNMSGGEQQRDFLPVEKVAQYIVAIALQNNINGIINCCSGEPIKVKDFVENYLAKKNKQLTLNLGYYPYADFEPMNFWGDTKKLDTVIKK